MLIQKHVELGKSCSLIEPWCVCNSVRVFCLGSQTREWSIIKRFPLAFIYMLKSPVHVEQANTVT